MVQPTQYGGAPAGNYAPPPAVDPYDLLEGGKRAIKFVRKGANGFDEHAPIGTSFTGLIVGDLRSMQVTDFTTKAPKFYTDGRPVMQIALDLQTEERDPEDPMDDGVRALYVKNQMLAAFQQALVPTKHLGRIGEGTRVTVTLVGQKDTGKGNPQKLYDIQIGPEFVAWVPPEQRATNSALYGAGAAVVGQHIQQAQQAGFPAQPQQPVQPQQQYVNPAQPTFPGQVVPQQAPGQQHQQPVAPQAPVQQAPQQWAAGGPPIQPAAPQQQVQPQGVPQQPQAPSPALAAVNAIANQPVAAPAAPEQGGITQEDVDSYQRLVAAHIDPQTALTSLAQQLGRGPDYIAALAAAVGVQPPA